MDLGTALANSIGMAMDYKHTSEGCKIQAAFAVFCSMSSYFWTAAIAFYLYLTIVREKQSLAKKLVKVFHIVAWGVPFIIVVLAGALNVLGYEDVNLSDNKSSSTVTGGWCFIRKSPGPKSERNQSHFTTRSDKAPVWYDKQWFEFWVMIAGGAWQIAAFIFCVVIYILIKIHIYREVSFRVLVSCIVILTPYLFLCRNMALVTPLLHVNLLELYTLWTGNSHSYLLYSFCSTCGH
jgi:G protein-coupled receptor 157